MTFLGVLGVLRKSIGRGRIGAREAGLMDFGRWALFSPRVDLGVFLGSALLSLLALGVGHQLGYLHSDSPEWTWVVAVLLVDVAHVWSTGFRIYFEPQELRRRPGLYLGTPLLCWLAGVLLYLQGAGLFWRALAYLAVWHFVRQQYGWVALYRARNQDPGGWHRLLDSLTIYLCTLYPLLYWHCHLPRNFWWFLPQDFAAVGFDLSAWVAPLYWSCLALYGVRALLAYLGHSGRPSPGKDVVVLTTWACWYLGIVVLNSDYAFTVTNVLIHGVPYMALVYYYRGSSQRRPSPPWWVFLVTLWALAYCEELLWDRAIWHERSWLFGAPWGLDGWHSLLVPLLATPQITHYVLDGFIWKRRQAPGLFSGDSIAEASAGAGGPARA